MEGGILSAGRIGGGFASSGPLSLQDSLQKHLVHFGIGTARIEIRYRELTLIYLCVASHVSFLLGGAAVLPTLRHAWRRRHRNLLRRVRMSLDHVEIDHFGCFTVVSASGVLSVFGTG